MCTKYAWWMSLIFKFLNGAPPRKPTYSVSCVKIYKIYIVIIYSVYYGVTYRFVWVLLVITGFSNFEKQTIYISKTKSFVQINKKLKTDVIWTQRAERKNHARDRLCFYHPI